MKGRINWHVSAVSLCLLAACASNAPVAPVPAAAVAAPVAAPAITPADGRSAATLAAEAGFRPTTRKGIELYCKRELMTGSRTKTTETCLTAAQLERQRNSVQDLMRDVQEMSDGGRPGNATDGSGGRYNNAMTQ